MHRILCQQEITKPSTPSQALIPKVFERLSVLRRQIAALPPFEAIEVLNNALRRTDSNAELLLRGLRQ